MQTIEIILFSITAFVLLFLLWRIVKHDAALVQLMRWAQEADKSILRLKRSINTREVQAYSNTVCSDCNTLLPENSVKTHDGFWLCYDCKSKRAEY